MKPVVFSWSGGKDSMLALHRMVTNNSHEVKALVTTVNEKRNRVSMHGLRHALVQQQAKTLGIPLHTVYIPERADNETYQEALTEQFREYKEQGISTIVFGDIYLEDVRQYREDMLEPLDIDAVFPIWGEDTHKLVHQFLEEEYQTITICIDQAKLDDRFIGRIVDQEFLDDLPKGVDPCGEDGEFHSFVFDGALFRQEVRFKVGERVQKTYPPPYENKFLFCDLLPEA